MKHYVMIVLFVLAATTCFAADPPQLINYQGVLRDASGSPLDGEHSMTFHFWDAENGGTEILLDRHDAADQLAVTVTDGMFSVMLGSGLVGVVQGYDSFDDIFRLHDELWLEVEVESELLAPRVRVAASGYALNAQNLSGRPASEFLDTSADEQVKPGKLVVGASSGTSSANGIEAYGAQFAGYFEHATGAGRAKLASASTGIIGIGSTRGGDFSTDDGAAAASLGERDFFGDTYGITAYGETAGAYFYDKDDISYALVASGTDGIEAYGSERGGYFSAGAGESTWVVLANTAGFNSAGIHAGGVLTGGYFTSSSSEARVAGSFGISASSGYGGGHFEDDDDTGFAYVARGEFGIDARGAYQAFRDGGGGRFEDTLYSGVAYVGHGNEGIYAEGTNAGGEFRDSDSSGWAQVGRSTYKIYGSGAVSFVQNHPDEKDKVVVYHAPEASEVSVYTRGKGALEGGDARLALDESFEWVTNPDLGLTAHLTPRGCSCTLHVTEISTTALTVGADDPTCASVEFDYMVWGLRIGFEESSPVQAKQIEAFVPAMDDHRATFDRDVSLRRFTALDRYGAMEPERSQERAGELLARIGVFDPAVHGDVAERRSPDSTGDAKSRPRPKPASGETSDHKRRPQTEVVADPLVVGVAADPSRLGDDGRLEALMAEGRYATVKVDAGFGAVIGKAIDALDHGQGTIRVFLAAR